jgi:hypothetical protein
MKRQDVRACLWLVFFPVYAEARLPTSSRLLERVQNDFRQRREGRRVTRRSLVLSKRNFQRPSDAAGLTNAGAECVCVLSKFLAGSICTGRIGCIPISRAAAPR